LIVKDSLKTIVEDELELLECLIDITNKNIENCKYLAKGEYHKIEVNSPDGISKIAEESVCNINSLSWDLDAVMDKIKNQLWQSTFLTYISSIEELSIKIATQKSGFKKSGRNDFQSSVDNLLNNPDKIYFDVVRLLRNNIIHSNCFEKHIGKESESFVFESNQQFPSIKFQQKDVEIYKEKFKALRIKDEVIVGYSFMKEVNIKLKPILLKLVKTI